ncbi:MAG: glycoside hydrolase family 1 protein, partial [Holdemanella sp.]|nr:glycoside hydrolase family 1 protein [Holdemanella sp.]
MFPNEFLWGGALSANQIEGAYRKAGKGLNTADVTTLGSRETKRSVTYEKNNEKFSLPRSKLNVDNATFKCLDNYYYPSKNAIDFYHTYKEDIQLLSQLEIRSLRLSINWSRLYPCGDESIPNKAGIEFYHKIFDELLKYKIVPIVTLSHYEIPLGLVHKYNGFYSKCTVDFFMNYVKTCLIEYKDKVKYWIVFNEINGIEYSGWLNAGVSSNNSSILAITAKNMLVANAKTVALAHEINPSNLVGAMVGYALSYPYTCNPED